jgi:hypothetical protein
MTEEKVVTEVQEQVNAALERGDEPWLEEFRLGHRDGAEGNDRNGEGEAYDLGFDTGSKNRELIDAHELKDTEDGEEKPAEGITNKLFWQPSPLGSGFSVVMYDSEGNRSNAIIPMDEAAMTVLLIQGWFAMILQAQVQSAFGGQEQPQGRTDSGIVIPGR